LEAVILLEYATEVHEYAVIQAEKRIKDWNTE
jgi:hypothetical protein